MKDHVLMNPMKDWWTLAHKCPKPACSPTFVKDCLQIVIQPSSPLFYMMFINDHAKQITKPLNPPPPMLKSINKYHAY